MPAPPSAVSPSSIYGDDDSVPVAPDDAFSVGSDDEEDDGLDGMEAVELDDPLSEIMEKEVFPGGCI